MDIYAEFNKGLRGENIYVFHDVSVKEGRVHFKAYTLLAADDVYEFVVGIGQRVESVDSYPIDNPDWWVRFSPIFDDENELDF